MLALEILVQKGRYLPTLQLRSHSNWTSRADRHYFANGIESRKATGPKQIAMGGFVCRVAVGIPSAIFMDLAMSHSIPTVQLPDSAAFVRSS